MALKQVVVFLYMVIKTCKGIKLRENSAKRSAFYCHLANKSVALLSCFEV